MADLVRFLISIIIVFTAMNRVGAVENYRSISREDYLNKMKGGWIGQMAGVGWGAPTEFKYLGEMVPASMVPSWYPGMVNQFEQDDIYVEMTFLQTLDQYGWDVSANQAGIDFANTSFNLWHANDAGRENLRRGIAPPNSGHPKYNQHADDIDYQIESDYAGLISPGMPVQVIELGEKFGQLMNYGDGLYAGQFIGGMYAEAFFETDMIKVIQAGLLCIPPQSQYAEMVRDVLDWYKQEPEDWQKTWQKVEKKYHHNPDYTHGLCSTAGAKGNTSIDAKLNGAYVLMGLLYGKGDPDQTMIIALRCGQDSDCNPSNAGGVLFTLLGYSNLPERFTEKIDFRSLFSHTRYTFPELVEVSEKLVKQAVLRRGGKVEVNKEGKDVLIIPVQKVIPVALMRSWDPGPTAGSSFTDEEREKIQLKIK